MQDFFHPHYVWCFGRREAASDGDVNQQKLDVVPTCALGFHQGICRKAFLAASGNSSSLSNLQQWHHWLCGRQPWSSVGFFVEAGSVGLEALDISTFNFNGQAAAASPALRVVFVKVLPLHVLLKSLSIIWMNEVQKAQALVGVTLGIPWQVKKVEETLKSMFLDLVHKHVLAVVKRNILHDNRHHGLNWRASRSVSCV